MQSLSLGRQVGGRTREKEMVITDITALYSGRVEPATKRTSLIIIT